jgi:hypothetical protein
VTANFGLSWGIMLVVMAWTALSFGMGWAVAQISSAAVLPVIGIAVVGYVLIGVVGSALNGIYSAALYRYAMTGEAGGFDARIMGHAFRQK